MGYRPLILALPLAALLPFGSVLADELPNGRYSQGTFAPVTFFCDYFPDGTVIENDACVAFYDGWVSTVYLTDYAGEGRFRGYWVTSVGVRCETEIAGSFYWGTLAFQFDETADSWTGMWGFCEDRPDRVWNGWR